MAAPGRVFRLKVPCLLVGGVGYMGSVMADAGMGTVFMRRESRGAGVGWEGSGHTSGVGDVEGVDASVSPL